ncbi:MAG: hypothetical protein AAGH46_00015 [Bacteroidota bacterium]
MNDEYSITVNTTGKLYNYVLDSNSTWEGFYRYSDRIRIILNTDFIDQIDDFDAKYWDFLFKSKVFTLHYHSMVGDVEIHTDKSNGTTEFQELLKQLEE